MKHDNVRRTLVGQALLVLMAGACGTDHDTIGPAEAIETYVAEYNAGDLDGIMALFSDDATITGHPTTPRATGRDEIRSVHAEEVGGPGRYAISNLETSGNTVTWDHEWGGDGGDGAFRFCVEGLAATVENGRITTWNWPDTAFQCDE